MHAAVAVVVEVSAGLLYFAGFALVSKLVKFEACSAVSRSVRNF